MENTLTTAHKTEILKIAKAAYEARVNNDCRGELCDILGECLADSKVQEWIDSAEGEDCDERYDLAISYAHDCFTAFAKAWEAVKLDDVVGEG